jgi:hypothetical protein
MPIEFVGRVVSVEPICSGSYSLTIGKGTDISLSGIPPDWMVPGVYVRILLNPQGGNVRIELLSDSESEPIRRLEAENEGQNPFAPQHGTT